MLLENWLITHAYTHSCTQTQGNTKTCTEAACWLRIQYLVLTGQVLNLYEMHQYNIHLSLYSMHPALYKIHPVLHKIHPVLHKMPSVLYKIHPVLYKMPPVLYMHHLLYEMSPVLYKMHTVLSKRHPVPDYPLCAGILLSRYYTLIVTTVVY